jgi:uncharacterized protein (DUF1786 family)
MGGGPVTDVLRARAAAHEVVMSASAAATLNHDADKVAAWGIRIVDDEAAEALRSNRRYAWIEIGDVHSQRIMDLVSALGGPVAFSAVAVCAQDHGAAPKGVSHLDFRHNLFKARLDASPRPDALLHGPGEIPPAMSRLAAIARSARRLPAEEIYVMDSGMAAILGAGMDPQVAEKRRFVVLDVATSHTVAAALEDGKIAGFFEYHTRDVTCRRIDELIVALADGTLSHEQILKQGGHGAYLRHHFGMAAVEAIVATGPKRRLVRDSRLPITAGAPLGDNMMTGTVGLLEAVRRRRQLPPIDYT